MNFKHITSMHFYLANVPKLLAAAIGAHHPVDAYRARCTTSHAEGGMYAAIA